MREGKRVGCWSILLLTGRFDGPPLDVLLCLFFLLNPRPYYPSLILLSTPSSPFLDGPPRGLEVLLVLGERAARRWATWHEDGVDPFGRLAKVDGVVFRGR